MKVKNIVFQVPNEELKGLNVDSFLTKDQLQCKNKKLQEDKRMTITISVPQLKKMFKEIKTGNGLTVHKGGFLPLIFAALGALGALAGGASSFATSVINAKKKNQELLPFRWSLLALYRPELSHSFTHHLQLNSTQLPARKLVAIFIILALPSGKFNAPRVALRERANVSDADQRHVTVFKNTQKLQMGRLHYLCWNNLAFHHPIRPKYSATDKQATLCNVSDWLAVSQWSVKCLVLEKMLAINLPLRFARELAKSLTAINLRIQYFLVYEVLALCCKPLYAKWSCFLWKQAGPGSGGSESALGVETRGVRTNYRSVELLVAQRLPRRDPPAAKRRKTRGVVPFRGILRALSGTTHEATALLQSSFTENRTVNKVSEVVYSGINPKDNPLRIPGKRNRSVDSTGEKGEGLHEDGARRHGHDDLGGARSVKNGAHTKPAIVRVDEWRAPVSDTLHVNQLRSKQLLQRLHSLVAGGQPEGWTGLRRQRGNVIPRWFTLAFRGVDEMTRAANGAASECKGGGNGRPPRKPANQRLRTTLFPNAKIPGVNRPGIKTVQRNKPSVPANRNKKEYLTTLRREPHTGCYSLEHQAANQRLTTLYPRHRHATTPNQQRSRRRLDKKKKSEIENLHGVDERNICGTGQRFLHEAAALPSSLNATANARLHHCGSKLDPRSDLRSTQKTVASFEFRAGLEIEMKFILNSRNRWFEISFRDQEPSSTNIDESEIQNHEISLVQRFYIGTKIKLGPGSELRSFDSGSGKMLVHPGIRLFHYYAFSALPCMGLPHCNSDEALGERVSVARIAPSLLDLGRAAPSHYFNYGVACAASPVSTCCDRIVRHPKPTDPTTTESSVKTTAAIFFWPEFGTLVLAHKWSIWNYFLSIVTNLTGRMSRSALVKIYAVFCTCVNHNQRSRSDAVGRLPASHPGKSVPDGVDAGFSRVGIVPDTASHSPRFTLISSQDHESLMSWPHITVVISPRGERDDDKGGRRWGLANVCASMGPRAEMCRTQRGGTKPVEGAAVAERLALSPPTQANLVQSPAGSPDFRKWESCRLGSAPKTSILVQQDTGYVRKNSHRICNPISTKRTMSACSLISANHTCTQGGSHGQKRDHGCPITCMDSLPCSRMGPSPEMPLAPAPTTDAHLTLRIKWLHRSPPTKAIRGQSPAGSRDFRKCWTMPLVGGFSRGSPVPPVLSFRCRSTLTSITLIGSQEPRCEMSVGQHRNEGSREGGGPRENPPTSRIVRHDSLMCIFLLRRDWEGRSRAGRPQESAEALGGNFISENKAPVEVVVEGVGGRRGGFAGTSGARGGAGTERDGAALTFQGGTGVGTQLRGAGFTVALLPITLRCAKETALYWQTASRANLPGPDRVWSALPDPVAPTAWPTRTSVENILPSVFMASAVRSEVLGARRLTGNVICECYHAPRLRMGDGDVCINTAPCSRVAKWTVAAWLKEFCTAEAWKRGSATGDRDMRSISLIAPTREALNWRAVLPYTQHYENTARLYTARRGDDALKERASITPTDPALLARKKGGKWCRRDPLGHTDEVLHLVSKWTVQPAQEIPQHRDIRQKHTRNILVHMYANHAEQTESRVARKPRTASDFFSVLVSRSVDSAAKTKGTSHLENKFISTTLGYAWNGSRTQDFSSGGLSWSSAASRSRSSWTNYGSGATAQTLYERGLVKRREGGRKKKADREEREGLLDPETTDDQYSLRHANSRGPRVSPTPATEVADTTLLPRPKRTSEMSEDRGNMWLEKDDRIGNEVWSTGESETFGQALVAGLRTPGYAHDPQSGGEGCGSGVYCLGRRLRGEFIAPFQPGLGVAALLHPSICLINSDGRRRGRTNQQPRALVEHARRRDASGRSSGVPAYLEIFPVSEAEKRGNYKFDTTTRYKCAIATKRKALNWRAVFSPQRRRSYVCTATCKPSPRTTSCGAARTLSTRVWNVCRKECKTLDVLFYYSLASYVWKLQTRALAPEVTRLSANTSSQTYTSKCIIERKAAMADALADICVADGCFSDSSPERSTVDGERGELLALLRARTPQNGDVWLRSFRQLDQVAGSRVFDSSPLHRGRLFKTVISGVSYLLYSRLTQVQVLKRGMDTRGNTASEVRGPSDTGDTNTRAQRLVAPTRKACSVSVLTLYCANYICNIEVSLHAMKGPSIKLRPNLCTFLLPLKETAYKGQRDRAWLPEIARGGSIAGCGEYATSGTRTGKPRARHVATRCCVCVVFILVTYLRAFRLCLQPATRDVYNFVYLYTCILHLRFGQHLRHFRGQVRTIILISCVSVATGIVEVILRAARTICPEVSTMRQWYQPFQLVPHFPRDGNKTRVLCLPEANAGPTPVGGDVKENMGLEGACLLRSSRSPCSNIELPFFLQDCEYGAASECKNGGNGTSLRKPANQWYRPTQYSFMNANARLHHRGSKLDPRSDLRSTQKTVAPFEFRAGLENEMKFISKRRNCRFEISIRDQQPSSINSEKFAYFHDVIYYELIAKFVWYLISISHFATKIDESEIQYHEILLVRHFYIGTKIKLDPGSRVRMQSDGSPERLTTVNRSDIRHAFIIDVFIKLVPPMGNKLEISFPTDTVRGRNSAPVFTSYYVLRTDEPSLQIKTSRRIPTSSATRLEELHSHNKNKGTTPTLHNTLHKQHYTDTNTTHRHRHQTYDGQLTKRRRQPPAPLSPERMASYGLQLDTGDILICSVLFCGLAFRILLRIMQTKLNEV
ncbi:hypothetical protein PR048_018990 [Dryococelus australis]|uniref:Uncharacterized protein n=1 Tax=Dryococelus australis TaxID=614101 RepID=A0ABQ9H2B4_9NEOP|nr:hypothetical protein PR048_018990 [Dryococelus australis]